MKRKNLNSLSSIQDYGSSDSEDDKSVPKKRLPAPSLPVFKEIRSITRQKENKDVDEKKIRNFPHEPGNWASYVYVPMTIYNEMLDFVNDVLRLLPSDNNDLSICEDFHISVTRTVILRHHWIKDFTNSISENINVIQPFFISFSGFKVFLNENKTRTFIALKVAEGVEQLKEIVKILDICLSDYKLPPFYQPASFHSSVLWCTGDKFDELNELINNLPEHVLNYSFCDKVSSLKCNSGNKVFTFNLYT